MLTQETKFGGGHFKVSGRAAGCLKALLGRRAWYSRSKADTSLVRGMVDTSVRSSNRAF